MLFVNKNTKKHKIKYVRHHLCNLQFETERRPNFVTTKSDYKGRVMNTVAVDCKLALNVIKYNDST